jgi:lipopolysaccharide export LptBFGC system permease protein LptF
MENVVMEVGEGRPGRPAYSHTATMATPADLREYEKRGAEYYLTHAHRGAEEFRLRDEILELRREIESELHARASFGVSCFILVVAGCALGMMFRTGNFLSAFALSVIPALISIALIVTGQHVGEAAESNLKMGLGIIWSGNVLVCGLAIGLFGHLRKL